MHLLPDEYISLYAVFPHHHVQITHIYMYARHVTCSITQSIFPFCHRSFPSLRKLQILIRDAWNFKLISLVRTTKHDAIAGKMGFRTLKQSAHKWKQWWLAFGLDGKAIIFPACRSAAKIISKLVIPMVLDLSEWRKKN